MSPSLSVVADNELRTAATGISETVAQRVRRLQAEARRLANEHVGAFTALMADLEAMAAEINGGGAAYPDGARAVAREVAMHCESRRTILEALKGRTS